MANTLNFSNVTDGRNLVTITDKFRNILFGIDTDTLEIINPSITRINAELERLDSITSSISGKIIVPYAPTVAYGQLPNPVYLYKDGILVNGGVDFAWKLPRANEEMVYLSAPDTLSSIQAEYYYWNDQNECIKLGEFPIHFSPPISQLVAPSVPQNIICLGDSTTLSYGGGFAGSWVNEFSRLLTGRGRAIQTDTAPPPSANLANIYFRGTLDKIATDTSDVSDLVKHEGRSGWATSEYIGGPSSGSGAAFKTNAFWNPNINAFDVAYYCQQNGFMHNQTVGGVLPDFSNLTMWLWLGWNDVYGNTVAGAINDMSILLDRIHASAPGAKVVLMGLVAPPKLMSKNTSLSDGGDESISGSRLVSQRTIFEQAIKAMGLAFRPLCEARAPWCEFYQISHVVCPETAYARVTRARSARSNLFPVEATYDYVHPREIGYAQVADAAYLKFIYDHCRGV